ncbi:MAG TPA: histidine kinase [Allosphingosinicella sp.]|nr:histidine kinase [Allosphingosinicella sp.]
MIRWASACASVLMLVFAIVFIWKSRAAAHDPIPLAPVAAAAAPTAAARAEPVPPPAASEKSREEKRFDRADRNKDGKIVLAELLAPRRKAFARLDTNHDGVLSFDEWAVRTEKKFRDADADRNGALTRAEYATTAPRRKTKQARCACQPAAATETGEE